MDAKVRGTTCASVKKIPREDQIAKNFKPILGHFTIWRRDKANLSYN